MMARLAGTFRSEWLKRKRSLTGWLVVGSVTFIPGVIFLSRFRRLDDLPRLYGATDFWPRLWVQSWEAMALMILPLSAMLLVTLLTQIETGNNAWKQLHATPQPAAAIYGAKLVVALVMLAQVVAGYVAAVYLAGALPAVLLDSIVVPPGFSWPASLRRGLDFFVETLPIVGLQFALAMRIRAFVPPLAIGIALWILSLGSMGWQYNYTLPYGMAGLDYLRVEYGRAVALPAEPTVIAGVWFFVFTAVGYLSYGARSDRG